MELTDVNHRICHSRSSASAPNERFDCSLGRHWYLGKWRFWELRGLLAQGHQQYIGSDFPLPRQSEPDAAAAEYGQDEKTNDVMSLAPAETQAQQGGKVLQADR